MADLDSGSGPDLIPEPDPFDLREWFLRASDRHRPESAAFQEAWNQPEYGQIYRKSVYWTDRIFSTLRPLRGLLRGLSLSASVGYLDPDDEGDRFGVVLAGELGVDSENDFAASFFRSDRVTPPGQFFLESTRYAEFQSRQIRGFDIALKDLQDIEREFLGRSGRPLGLTLRVGVETLSSRIDHPLMGTSACYVSRHFPNLSGILTCRHVIEDALGREARDHDSVTMSSGRECEILGLAPPPIDAGILMADVPDDVVHLDVLPYVAQYLPVDIQRSSGLAIPNRVTSVTDTYNVWDDPDTPAYLDLETPALPGDSGALVTDRATGLATGMYRGRFDALNPPKSVGRAAHMYQIQQLMGLELYN